MPGQHRPPPPSLSFLPLPISSCWSYGGQVLLRFVRTRAPLVKWEHVRLQSGYDRARSPGGAPSFAPFLSWVSFGATGGAARSARSAARSVQATLNRTELRTNSELRTKNSSSRRRSKADCLSRKEAMRVRVAPSAFLLRSRSRHTLRGRVMAAHLIVNQAQCRFESCPRSHFVLESARKQPVTRAGREACPP